MSKIKIVEFSTQHPMKKAFSGGYDVGLGV
jgi:hypothetical protein